MGISSIIACSSAIASLSCISVRQLDKKDLSLLTFCGTFFWNMRWNHSGISFTSSDIDGSAASTNSGHTSKNTSFYFWTLNDTLFCVVGRTYNFSCSCYLSWSYPVVAPPQVMIATFGSYGSTTITWTLVLGFGFSFYTGLGLVIVRAFHFVIN